MEKPRVLIVTTMDTNVQEATFLKECLVAEEVRVLILDAGIKSKSPIPVEISRDEIAIAASSTIDDVQDMGYEGKALSIMISGAIRTANELYDAGKIDGIIGIGGSMETTLGTAVMRTFPIGFPKLMISFVASSNTRSLVGTKDIMMLYSSYDFADLNGMAKHILREGALAMAGMTKEKRAIPTEGRPIAVLSTLGMTESCAVYLRQRLESMRMEVITFDTVGSGGEAMDEFIRDEDVRLVIDFSLHEIVDHLFGGDYDAGPMRSMAALQKGTPTILIPGNTDFILTGPLEKAKDRFPGRLMHDHSASITAVRTNPSEMQQLAKHIADLCGKAKGPVAVIMPMGGLSAFDSPDGPLENPDGRDALAQTLEKKLPQTIPFIRSTHHINHPAFAGEVINCIAHISRESS